MPGRASEGPQRASEEFLPKCLGGPQRNLGGRPQRGLRGPQRALEESGRASEGPGRASEGFGRASEGLRRAAAEMGRGIAGLKSEVVADLTEERIEGGREKHDRVSAEVEGELGK